MLFPCRNWSDKIKALFFGGYEKKGLTSLNSTGIKLTSFAFHQQDDMLSLSLTFAGGYLNFEI